MSARKKEKIAGWSIATFGLIIALYGGAIELTAGVAGPSWGWLIAGIVLVFTGWIAGRYGWLLITGRAPHR
jgi:hypothetical protein